MAVLFHTEATEDHNSYPQDVSQSKQNPQGAPCVVRAHVTRTSSNYQLEVIKAQRNALCAREKCVQAAGALLGKFLSQNY